jgi:hypothetical protein
MATNRTDHLPPSLPITTDQMLGLGIAAVAGIGALAIAVGSLLPLFRATSFFYSYNDVPLIMAGGLLGAAALAVLAVGLAIPRMRLAAGVLALGGGLLLGVSVVAAVQHVTKGNEAAPAGSFTIGPGCLVLLLGALLACASGVGGAALGLREAARR